MSYRESYQSSPVLLSPERLGGALHAWPYTFGGRWLASRLIPRAEHVAGCVGLEVSEATLVVYATRDMYAHIRCDKHQRGLADAVARTMNSVESQAGSSSENQEGERLTPKKVSIANAVFLYDERIPLREEEKRRLKDCDSMPVSADDHYRTVADMAEAIHRSAPGMTVLARAGAAFVTNQALRAALLASVNTAGAAAVMGEVCADERPNLLASLAMNAAARLTSYEPQVYNRANYHHDMRQAAMSIYLPEEDIIGLQPSSPGPGDAAQQSPRFEVRDLAASAHYYQAVPLPL